MDRQNRVEQRTSKGSSGGPLLAGLMIGGLVGAGAMLLLAPQAGKRTREELQEGVMDVKDRATARVKDTVADVRSKAEQVASNVKDTADQLQNQGKDIAIDQLDRVATAAQARKRALQSSRNNDTSA